MDEHEKALRHALFDVALKMVEGCVASTDWDAVLQLIQRFAETMMGTPEADALPESERRAIASDTARIATRLLREQHVVGGLLQGAMMLVWRCVSYATPLRYREREPGIQIRLDKREIEAFESLLRRGWAEYWEHFEGELMRDSRGAKADWNAASLMSAINTAAPHVPGARWSYKAVAERITQDMALDPPLTGEALRKLIQRHRAGKLWETWKRAKQTRT